MNRFYFAGRLLSHFRQIPISIHQFRQLFWWHISRMSIYNKINLKNQWPNPESHSIFIFIFLQCGVELNWLFNVTINDISVIYVTAIFTVYNVSLRWGCKKKDPRLYHSNSEVFLKNYYRTEWRSQTPRCSFNRGNSNSEILYRSVCDAETFTGQT